jgi:hypothetical protein
MSSPPVDDNVNKTPAEERDDCDQEKLFEAVTEVQECYVRQDAEAAEVFDDAQTGGRDERDQGRLFEAVTEAQTFDDSPTRLRRSPGPNSRYSQEDYSQDDYSPDDYSQDDYSQDDYSQDDYSPDDYSQDDYSPDDYKTDDHKPYDNKPDDYSPDDYNLDYVKGKPRTKSRRSTGRARGLP